MRTAHQFSKIHACTTAGPTDSIHVMSQCQSLVVGSVVARSEQIAKWLPVFSDHIPSTIVTVNPIVCNLLCVLQLSCQVLLACVSIERLSSKLQVERKRHNQHTTIMSMQLLDVSLEASNDCTSTASSQND